MDTALSVLKLSSGMARHAAASQMATARNIAQADVPGTKALRVKGFAESFDELERGDEIQQYTENKAVSLEAEMLTLAEARGRQDAAIAMWKSTLNMMRLAVGGPQR